MGVNVLLVVRHDCNFIMNYDFYLIVVGLNVKHIKC